MSALLRLPLLLLLAGCAGSGLAGDPIDRPGTWAPQGDNAANLRAMVADPRDLVAGRGEADGLASEAAPAAGLLLSGKRLSLPGMAEAAGGASAPAQGGGNAASQ